MLDKKISELNELTNASTSAVFAISEIDNVTYKYTLNTLSGQVAGLVSGSILSQAPTSSMASGSYGAAGNTYGSVCTMYKLKVVSTGSPEPATGEVILNSSSSLVRIHKEDVIGNDLAVFYDTKFKSKQFEMFWKSTAQTPSSVSNTAGLYHDQCEDIVLDVSCSTLPTAGSPSDPGLVSAPSHGQLGVFAILAYSPTIEGLRAGGSAVSTGAYYLDPLYIRQDVADITGSNFLTTEVFRRDNMEFVTENTNASMMAYASTYLNSGSFTFDTGSYTAPALPKIYRNAGLTSEAPTGYYIFLSEYNNAAVKKNAVYYTRGASGSLYSDTFKGWDHVAATPTSPATNVCTAITASRAVRRAGSSNEYFEFYYDTTAVSGSYSPTSFTESYICFDAAGLDFCLSQPSTLSGTGETVTKLVYSPDLHALAYIDEDLGVNVEYLNVNSISYDSNTGVLSYIDQRGDTTTLTLATGSISADTGSLLYSGSFNSSNSVLTLYSANQNYNLNLSSLISGAAAALTASDEGVPIATTITEFDFVGNAVSASALGTVVTITVNTGSVSFDTGSFMTTGSVNGTILTFEKGDGSTFDLTLDTGSNPALIYNSSPNTTSILPVQGGNTSIGAYSTVGGGTTNTASGNCSIAGGGYCNTASSLYSFIGGGTRNEACNTGAVVGGGGINIASGGWSTISGGRLNAASANFSIIGGGDCNIASGIYSFVGGGNTNCSNQTYATIAGGIVNTASGQASIVGGGRLNTALGDCSTIGGGLSNCTTGNWGTIAGGYDNTASGCYAGILSGEINEASGAHSVVAGGVGNTSSGNTSVTVGGTGNTASGLRSGILGGRSNNTNGCADSFIIGSCLTALASCTTYTNNFYVSGSTLTAPNLPNTTKPNVLFFDDTTGVISYGTTGSFGTGTPLDTGSFLYSGSFNSGTNALTLYSPNQNYNVDLSSLISAGAVALTASDEGTPVATTISEFDFIGNAITATALGSVVSVTVNTGSDSYISNVGYSAGTLSFTGQSNAFNSSVGISDITGSSLVAASVLSNDITFTKGDGSTFAITVDTGSDSYVSNVTYTSGSVSFTGVGSGFNSSINISSITGSSFVSATTNLNDITFTRGDGSTSVVTVDTGSDTVLTINNNVNNRLLTANGSTTSIDAEANVTYDPFSSTLSVNTNVLRATSTAVGVNTTTPSVDLEVTGEIKVGSGHGTVGTLSGVLSGNSNTASGNCTVVAGGWSNTACTNLTFIGGGFGNTASNNYSHVGGGISNTASGNSSAVVGGGSNIASGSTSFVGGGQSNQADGVLSSIVGGGENIASGTYSTITGGRYNTSSGVYATTVGYCNIASANHSSIGGGSDNRACGLASTIGGGVGNIASGSCSTIAGGCCNTASGFYASTVGGGRQNIASGDYSTIGGGIVNIASGTRTTVGGGIENAAVGYNSTISGGYVNTASGSYDFIGGGYGNLTRCDSSVVAGGFLNSSLANTSVIAGGRDSCNTAAHSTIGGGSTNYLLTSGTQYDSLGSTIGGGVGHNSSGGTFAAGAGYFTVAPTGCCTVRRYSTIGGGFRNCSLGSSSTVSGGCLNISSASGSFVGGGHCNAACSNCSTVVGGNSNTVTAGCASIVGGQSNQATGNWNFVGGGSANCTAGCMSVVAGGLSNDAIGNYSTIAGGGTGCAVGANSFIGGGTSNTICSFAGTIAGGGTNTVTAAGFVSTIAGGCDNTVSGQYAFIGGGLGNTASGNYSGILGGQGNTNGCADSFIIGSNLTATAACTTFTNNLNVGGTLTKSAGSFRIPHPDPSKTQTTDLVHSFVESPTAGDNLYRFTVEVVNGFAKIDLPDYYRFLNDTDDQVWVSPANNFGRGYGVVSPDQTEVYIYTDIDGIYNILVIGTRKDQIAKDYWKGPEQSKQS